MKKLTLMTLLTMTASLLLTGCVNVNIEAPETESSKGKEAKVFEAEDYESEEIAAENSDKSPLAGYDVVYQGEFDGDDPVTIKLVQKFIDETGCDAEDILSVAVCDYRQDGNYGAFIFVGEEDEDGWGYEGSIFYVGDEGVSIADNETEYWRGLGECMIFDGISYYLADDNKSTSDIITHMWFVDKGKPYENIVSGFGQIYRYSDDCICVVYSAYDGAYFKEDELWEGHTYKPYYFFLDERFNEFVGYGGAELTPEEINQVAGYDIVSEIEALGDYTVTNGFYRKNGILNINYMTDNDEAIGYYNCNLDVNTGEFIPGLSKEATLKGSDFGGTYEPYAFEDMNAQWSYPGAEELPDNNGKGKPAGGSSKSSEGKALSKSELESITTYFNNNLNGFLVQNFDDVRDADLNEVFYNGLRALSIPTDEEVKAYLKAVGQSEVHTDLIRLYTDDIDEALRFFTGYGYSDMRNKLGWTYIKKYDAYFLERGDTNYLPFVCVEGKILDVDTETDPSDSIETQELKFVVDNGKPYKEGDPYKRVIVKTGELLTQIVSVEQVK